MQNLHNKKIIILAHVLTTVPAEDLKNFFIAHKVEKLLFIALPLFFQKGRPGPYYQFFQKGKLVKEKKLPNKKLPSLVQYVRDFLLGFYWILINGKSWDVIIALDNLNTATALFARLFGRVKKVIFYTIDFVPKRFESPLLDALYHQIDKFAVIHSDATWNLTQRMIVGREKYLHLNTSKLRNQHVVPIGVWLKTIPNRNVKQHTKKIVYAGGLAPHQGIQLVLDALPLVIKKIPNVSFTVIGMGNFESDLKKQTKKNHIEKYVNFLGYMETHKEVENELAKGDIAMAMYSKDLDKWSYFADPSKIKTYLAVGLPVITTDVTYIARDLEKARCGIVVPYDKTALAYAIIDMLSNKKKHEAFSANALQFSKEFDWEKIFLKGLSYV